MASTPVAGRPDEQTGKVPGAGLTYVDARPESGGVALRVVFAEDNYLVRAGTAALLAESEHLELVGLVGTGVELLAAVAEHRPDVVLTDIRMPPTWTNEGIEAALRIRREHPATGVVVLSQYVEQRYAADLLRDGAGGIGYLLKERIADLGQLIDALTAVARGGSVLDPRVVEAIMATRDATGFSPVQSLSPREREVLEAMATGLSNTAIGRRLYLSERAVEKNINQIFGKFGLSQELDVNRRVRAVITFLEARET